MSTTTKQNNGSCSPNLLPVRERFRRFAYQVACVVGSPAAFLSACILLLIWAASGPIFHFSDTWQLVINTATTIITFLMVFLIQSTQNRDAKAIHLKLDELIRSVSGARNRLVRLEDLSDEELAKLEKEFARLRERSAKRTSPSNAN
jgi:low affinity Fe/Cu permease